MLMLVLHAGSGSCSIGPIRFLARWCTRPLNQAFVLLGLIYLHKLFATVIYVFILVAVRFRF